MSLPLSSPAPHLTPEQVRECIKAHLQRKYVLNEAEVLQIAYKWRHSGKDFQQFDLRTFRVLFGLTHGTIFWCDERRITTIDQSMLKVDLPKSGNKFGSRGQWEAMAFFGAFGLLLFILAYFQGGIPSWNFWAWMEGGTFVVAITMFRLGRPDPVPKRPDNWNNKEEGLGGVLENDEKQDSELIDFVDRIC